MVDLIKQIGEIGAINVVVCTVLVCMLVVGAVSLKDQLFDKLGILTKKSLRENKINQQLEENTSRIKKLETDFKDMEENLYKKQEEYHEQSVSVRENLRGSQNDLKESLKELRSMMLDKEIDDMRWELLNFANAVINKRDYNKEQYDHALDMYSKYERILKDNNLENGRVTASMEFVKNKYQELSETGFKC